MASFRTLDRRVQPVAQWFVRQLKAAGIRVTITSTRRDRAKQARLYNEYLAGRSKYPVAPPGKSTHAIGLAFDLHLDPPLYDDAGRLWEALGLTWGGRFNDRIHFDARPR